MAEARYTKTRAVLEAWFTERRWAHVYPIISAPNRQGVSLRTLEFLVTHYSRNDRNSVVYEIREPGGGSRRFNLYVALQTHQMARRKKNIEPFARANPALPDNGHFRFGHGEDVCRTNVAQLQFMRFILENQVLAWLGDHLDEVKEAKRVYEREHRSAVIKRPVSDARIIADRVRSGKSIKDFDERSMMRGRNRRRRRRYQKRTDALYCVTALISAHS